MTDGWNASRPMAIHRKEDPQIIEIVNSRAQSVWLKFPSFRPADENRLEAGADTEQTLTTTVRRMRRSFVGFVTLALVLAAGCTDDPTVEERVTTEPPQPTLEIVEEAGAEPAETAEEAGAEPVETAEPGVTAGESDDAAETVGDGLFPTVVGASASSSDGVSWRVDVTLSSEYDTPERYADAWRVLDAEDNELGIRVLGHDHANEQPFTRSTTVDIPADVETVYIEGRDQVNGWSGERFELELNR